MFNFVNKLKQIAIDLEETLSAINFIKQKIIEVNKADSLSYLSYTEQDAFLESLDFSYLYQDKVGQFLELKEGYTGEIHSGKLVGYVNIIENVNGEIKHRKIAMMLVPESGGKVKHIHNPLFVTDDIV